MTFSTTLLATVTEIMIVHMMPNPISTNCAMLMMSSWVRSSSKVALPIDRGEPGTIFGVGVGVGRGVGVGVGVDVGSIGTAVGVGVDGGWVGVG
jgi:hypothetical protein